MYLLVANMKIQVSPDVPEQSWQVWKNDIRIFMPLIFWRLKTLFFQTLTAKAVLAELTPTSGTTTMPSPAAGRLSSPTTALSPSGKSTGSTNRCRLPSPQHQHQPFNDQPSKRRHYQVCSLFQTWQSLLKQSNLWLLKAGKSNSPQGPYTFISAHNSPIQNITDF